MAYILDKESLMNLCEFFGGQVIKVPTVHEFENLIYGMLLYQYVKIDHIDYNEAVKLIGYDSSELRQIKTVYQTICKVMKEYSFIHQGDLD